jgi:CRISPR/Cas system-associated exonuclease Cas4 (RecB family)
MGALLLRASSAQRRIDRARAWLAERRPGEEILVLAANSDAAHDLLRQGAREKGACFGWHRATLERLAAELALPALAARGLAPVGALPAQAVVARVLHDLRGDGGLGRFESVADGPGLVRAAARVLDEVRFAGVEGARLEGVAPELARIRDAYARELERAGLADRAEVFACAVAAAGDPERRHPWLDRPTLLLDLSAPRALERDLLRAVMARAPEALATHPAGDPEDGLDFDRSEELDDASDARSLSRLQRHLFEAPPPEAERGDDVVVLSAPGESRECVEIARRMLELAQAGTPFDQMAVLLRAAEVYRPHLEEAFARARIPAHFARGAVAPDPAGRAFLALLACAAEDLSARRFAEYLSLGEVPPATDAGEPPPAPPSAERWVLPDESLLPEGLAEALAPPPDDEPGAPPDVEEVPVVAGSLRAPRRWENLLVEAAVIGGRDRWARRLAGLAEELKLDLAAQEDPDGAVAARLTTELRDLGHLRDYALPLIDALAELPDSAVWGDWIDALSALASRALRRPERVLSALSELVPMAPTGPVELAEVQRVLEPRLLELAERPSAQRYGKVYVAPAESARGLAFDVVFVPGLAERIFPAKIQEEPILPDAARRRLAAGLDTNEERRLRERRVLRLAVGAARQRVVLSYPRLDLDQARPRVPSFYTLEAVRAAEGRLTGFEALAAQAERASDTRIGWPAPSDSRSAIDEAEHDLAVLESIQQREESESLGAARFLLESNPHLGRALRFRARRWLRRWTGADGLVRPDEGAREHIDEGALEALRRHALGERSYSPTALQHFAACPYRFFLYAVHRLSPREEPEAIEEIDPLSRGSLVHDVQFHLLRRLQQEDLLPVRPANLERAGALLEEILDQQARDYRDRLAPAIERVWEDGVASVRADLREWLRRASLDASGFVPWRFELSFGLPPGRARDEHSTPEPVELDCGLRLRGAIDLVERRSDEPGGGATLRVTDHKTGRDRVRPGAVVAGGESLQPVLYALATEKLVPSAGVESGRLYYCTAAGGFREVDVPLDAVARDSAKVVADVIASSLEEPFLPAAPADDRTCHWCDYRPVCGPYEWQRTLRKPAPRRVGLQKLRELS